ncbi:hypothetical protein [Thiohalomonas denitrificans]|uniref:PhnA-like protein n=1 Tax=Thiohalomonas denitrificans TaxID=415747 RepID=A0A1G5QKG6_9GAMM|nr:hypothetical protein [Thiohalomonas denitrificans]SCZ62108.1 hypothetical protein SAMN03097708_02260 [Thiohalomonas denitrificans]
MVTQAYDVERMAARRPIVGAVSWGAVFAGTVAGLSIYLLLALIGVATGLTAVDPAAAEPVGSIPLWTGVWSFISMLIAAFSGGWVAGRMSGLRRKMDGALHGLVAWGLTVLFAGYLATTAVAGILGGTLNIFGQTLQTAGQAAGATGATEQLQQIISGAEGGDISLESMGALRDRLSAQDRSGAIEVMTSEMGFSQQRAEQVVDQAMPLFQQPGQQAQQIAEPAVGVATAASWWLIVTLAVSLVLGIWGGAIGTRGTSKRIRGDHSDERYHMGA